MQLTVSGCSVPRARRQKLHRCWQLLQAVLVQRERVGTRQMMKMPDRKMLSPLDQPTWYLPVFEHEEAAISESLLVIVLDSNEQRR